LAPNTLDIKFLYGALLSDDTVTCGSTW
jgi:hypothetical protein